MRVLFRHRRISQGELWNLEGAWATQALARARHWLKARSSRLRPTRAAPPRAQQPLFPASPGPRSARPRAESGVPSPCRLLAAILPALAVREAVPATPQARIRAAPKPGRGREVEKLDLDPEPVRLPRSALPTFLGPVAPAPAAVPVSPLLPVFPSRAAASSTCPASARPPATLQPPRTAPTWPAIEAPASPS